MTTAALRRIADQTLVDADSLASDAGRLRSQAASLRGLLDPLVSISQRVWVGPAASDFEQNSRARAGQIDGQAARLNRIASEFDGRSGQLRREAAALRRQADAADAAPIGIVPTGVF